MSIAIPEPNGICAEMSYFRDCFSGILWKNFRKHPFLMFCWGYFPTIFPVGRAVLSRATVILGMISTNDRKYLEQAIALAKEGIEQGQGGPFGCIIVKDGKVIGKGCNQVTSTNDPTAHAEVVAIRDACKNLGNFQLTDCDFYASCEPCPMCLGAIYWARPRRVVYAATRYEAADAGFDDDLIYQEIGRPSGDRQIPFEFQSEQAAIELFSLWKKMGNKKLY
jgi:guanine deaminase